MRAFLLPFVMISGCYGPYFGASGARLLFTETYHCTKTATRLTGDDVSTPYEITGCGYRDEYSCNTYYKDLHRGCISIRDAAIAAAAQGWSCPKSRVTTEPTPTPALPAPPAEIANDPARLSMWRKQQAVPETNRTVVAEGCGRHAELSCEYSITSWESSGIEATGGNWQCSAPALGN